MLDFEEDMAEVFFSDDFATRFERVRAAAAPLAVAGILGIADEEALEGRVIATVRVLRLPAACDVRVGDVLVALDSMPSQGIEVGARFKVLEPPQRVIDGAEMDALLGSAPP